MVGAGLKHIPSTDSLRKAHLEAGAGSEDLPLLMLEEQIAWRQELV